MSHRPEDAPDELDDLEHLHGLSLSGLSLNIQASNGNGGAVSDDDSRSTESPNLGVGLETTEHEAHKERAPLSGSDTEPEDDIVAADLGKPSSASDTEPENDAPWDDPLWNPSEDGTVIDDDIVAPDLGKPSSASDTEAEDTEPEDDPLWNPSEDGTVIDDDTRESPAPPPARPRSALPTRKRSELWQPASESIIIDRLKQVEEKFKDPDSGDPDYMFSGNSSIIYRNIILGMIDDIRRIAVETKLIAYSMMKKEGASTREVLSRIVSKMSKIVETRHAMKAPGGGKVFPMSGVDTAITNLRKLVNTYKGVNRVQDNQMKQMEEQLIELRKEILRYVELKMDPSVEPLPEWLIELNKQAVQRDLTSDELFEKVKWLKNNYIRKAEAQTTALETMPSIVALRNLLESMNTDASKRQKLDGGESKNTFSGDEGDEEDF